VTKQLSAVNSVTNVSAVRILTHHFGTHQANGVAKYDPDHGKGAQAVDDLDVPVGIGHTCGTARTTTCTMAAHWKAALVCLVALSGGARLRQLISMNGRHLVSLGHVANDAQIPLERETNDELMRPLPARLLTRGLSLHQSRSVIWLTARKVARLVRLWNFRRLAEEPISASRALSIARRQVYCEWI